MDKRIILKEAVEFHGHLGPYLILGLKAGELALKKLGCKKYFDLQVRVWGANKKPKSCLIDGLQLSTGATYGKGNISKLDGKIIRIEVRDCKNNRSVVLKLKESLMRELELTKTHTDSERLAKKLWREKIGAFRT